LGGPGDPIAAEDMRDEASTAMHDWAREIRADPEQMNNRLYQPYAVLSYCRMLYTRQTGRIVSKPAAASWAQGALDPEWSGPIGRALLERADSSLSVQQKPDSHDFGRALAFIDYALELLADGDPPRSERIARSRLASR
jgi:hypothetical protein